MRRPVLLAVQAGLLAGPTVLAFLDGGYFTGARLGALVVTYALLAGALATLDGSGPLDARGEVEGGGGQAPATRRAGGQTPGARADRRIAGGQTPGARADRRIAGGLTPGVVAVGGLALLALWTTVSVAWAPVEAPAIDARERALLYLGALAAAALAFRGAAARRAVEPALAAGTVVVVGYGLLDALALVDLEDSAAAGGRLYHPLTYWNAEGALAAMGFVLAARLAGTRDRPLGVRLGAAAATPLLGLGVWLTFSRGSLTALGVGVAVLLALTPAWSQLRAAAIALEATVLAVVAFEVLPREAVVAPLLVVMLLAAAAQGWSARAEAAQRTRLGALPASRPVRGLAWAAAAVLAVAPFAAAALDRDERDADPAFGATAQRLGSAGSDRFGYWEVALEAFAADPAAGAGAGAFTTEWIARRDVDETVRDAHSLVLETAAELGAVGLALLLVFLGGVAAAARRWMRADPGAAAGPVAALAVWAAHAAIDWDWEMPALTLVAVVLAGVALAHPAPAWPAATGRTRAVGRRAPEYDRTPP